MKKAIRGTLAICMAIGILLGLSACSAGTSAAKTQDELEIDYLVTGEQTEQVQASENETLWEWLKNKMSGDKKPQSAESESASEQSSADGEKDEKTVKSLYQKNEDEKNAESSDSSSSQSSSQNEKPNSKDDNGNESSSGAEEGSHPEEEPAEPSQKKNTVTMHIRCDTAVANGMHLESKWAGVVPANGIILPTTTFEIKDGDTALDVLCAARDKFKLHMQYEGSKSSAYVQGINNLYEFDGGRWSGWMYSVNGWYPNYGCGVYVLKSGDKIEWNYTCDLGLDLDADMEGAEDWKENHE